MAGDDLNLPLQTQVLDTATPINNAVTNMQHDQLVQGQVAMQPLERQELQTRIAGQQFQNMDQQSQAYIRGHVMAGAILKPYLDAGNTDAAKEVLGRMSGDPILGKDAANAIQMLNNGQGDQLKQQVDGMVGFGTQMGIISPKLQIVSPGDTVIDATGRPVMQASPWGALGGAAPAANGAQAAPAGGTGAAPPAPAMGVAPMPTVNGTNATPPALPQNGAAPSAAPPAPASGIPAPPTQGANPAAPASGLNEQYLATLPPQAQQIIKGLVNGDIQPPSMSGRNAQLAMQLDAAARTYDPTYSALDFPVRKAMRINATSGKLGQSTLAINTLAQHLTELKSAGEALDNTQFPLVNSMSNYFAGATGQSNITNFQAVKDVVANELAKALVGSQTAESDRKEAMDRFNAAQSPDQLNGAIQHVGKLLAGKVQANADQYAESMKGAGQGFQPVSPNAAKAYAALGINILPQATGQGADVVAPQGAANAGSGGGWKYIGKVQ